MSISSIGPYGSATIVNSDLFNDVETLKETVATLGTTYLQTTQEHRDDISTNRLNINDISNNRIVAIEQDTTDISNNRITAIEDDITDISNNRIKDIEDNITDLSDNRIKDIEDNINPQGPEAHTGGGLPTRTPPLAPEAGTVERGQ